MSSHAVWAASEAGAHERTPRALAQWLQQMQTASQRHSYVGELQVQSGGRRTRSLIQHVNQAQGSYEDRVEALGARARISYRQPGEVLTVWPQLHQALHEKRDAIPSFPLLLPQIVQGAGSVYVAQLGQRERVAGHWAQSIEFIPADHWRYAYTVWAEEGSALPLKMQTRDAQGQVLEEARFLTLQLDPSAASLRQRETLAGYQVRSSPVQRTNAQNEGWRLNAAVAGFATVDCYRRLLGPNGNQAAVQWILSDGLASLSLFLQAYDSQQQRQEVELVHGATRVLTRRIGDWWLTAVGEVPPQTLRAFADGLQRVP